MSAEAEALEETPDFLATGSPAREAIRFRWQLDNDTLKDINRAIALDSEVHGRGFLGRLLLHWIGIAPDERPDFIVPSMRHNDLRFVPSPCYIIALSDDRRTLRCWYSVLVDSQPHELLAGEHGVFVFEIEGDADLLGRYSDAIAKAFRFKSTKNAGGFTFHRMI